jgi:hypothetical protein
MQSGSLFRSANLYNCLVTSRGHAIERPRPFTIGVLEFDRSQRRNHHHGRILDDCPWDHHRGGPRIPSRRERRRRKNRLGRPRFRFRFRRDPLQKPARVADDGPVFDGNGSRNRIRLRSKGVFESGEGGQRRDLESVTVVHPRQIERRQRDGQSRGQVP